MSDLAIRARRLVKTYGSTEAVRGIDLEIERGEIFALLGPNGAGKTTTVEILEGYRARTSGDVTVLGMDPATADREWRRKVGIVLQTPGHFDEMTVREALQHYADIYAARRSVDEVLSAVGLLAVARRLCASLSGGQLRRLDLALGIIGDPELLFLDEPTTGFDPQARRDAWDLISSLTSQGTTVLLTTHFMDEAARLADRVGVMRDGALTRVAAPALLSTEASRATAKVIFQRTQSLRRLRLPRSTQGHVVESGGEVTITTREPTRTVAELIRWASAQRCDEIPGLAIVRPTLEDAYLALVAGD